MLRRMTADHHLYNVEDMIPQALLASVAYRMASPIVKVFLYGVRAKILIAHNLEKSRAKGVYNPARSSLHDCTRFQEIHSHSSPPKESSTVLSSWRVRIARRRL